MPRPSQDEYYLGMLRDAASRSTCVRRKVAAIFVDERGRCISMGYNGVPQGFEHCIDVPCPGASDPPGSTDRCMSIHAEINAILNCTLALDEVHTVYLSCTPCFACGKALANLGNLKRVVCLEKYADTRGFDVLAGAGCAIFVNGV